MLALALSMAGLLAIELIGKRVMAALLLLGNSNEVIMMKADFPAVAERMRDRPEAGVRSTPDRRRDRAGVAGGINLKFLFRRHHSSQNRRSLQRNFDRFDDFAFHKDHITRLRTCVAREPRTCNRAWPIARRRPIH